MNSQIQVQPPITLRALTLDHRKIWVVFGSKDLNPTTQAGSKFPTPIGGTEAPNAESGLGF